MRQGDYKFKVNLGYITSQPELYGVGRWREGEMSLQMGVKAKELPQGIANEAPLWLFVCLFGWIFALDK